MSAKPLSAISVASVFGGLAFVVASVGMASAPAMVQAASFDSVPPECQAQVTNAVRALTPAFSRKARSVTPSTKGSIEQSIFDYAPPRLHAVDEGTLPPPMPNARCPEDMANVGGRFCVDKYEGSIVERASDGTTRPHSPYDTLVPCDDVVYVARSVANVVPQGYISAMQAQRACVAAGKRLCQAVEWRAACAGTQGFKYPYGPNHVAGACRDHGVAPMMTFHAATMKRGWGPIELNDPRNNQLDDTVAKTGTHPNCVNDVGAFDMVGNLHEWTADPNGTFQGGYWLDTSQHGEGCAYRTIAHGFEYRDYSTGFRCCATPTDGP